MRAIALFAIAAFACAGCLHIDVHKTEEISSISHEQKTTEFNDQSTDD